MNAKQQREWEDDVTQPCAFPEPLAEVLTRENRELRAKLERWGEAARLNAIAAERECRRADRAEAIAADATTAAQNLRDELQGAQERLQLVRELAEHWDDADDPMPWAAEQILHALDAEP